MIASSGDGAVSARLVDHKLERSRVQVQAIGDRGVAYFGEDRVLEQAGFDRVVELIFDASSADGGKENKSASDAADQRGRLLHVTGQRLAGTWQGGTADGDGVRWQHPRLGRVTVSLEELRGFRRAGARLPAPSSDDQVLLANGDTLAGFVTQIKKQTLHIRTKQVDQPIPLPMKRVRAVRLGSAAKAWPGEPHRLTLSDGSRLAAEALALQGKTLRVRLPWLSKERVEVPVGQVSRLRFTGAGWRLIHLAERPPEVVSGGQVFGLDMRPRRDGRDMRLHAPVTIRWPVPAGAQRFAGEAVLSPAASAGAVSRWADCTLTLLAGTESSLQTIRLQGKDAGSHAINVSLASPDSLTLRLEAGANGPVLDRVLLRNPRLLIREPQ